MLTAATQVDDRASGRLNPKYTFESFVIGSSNRFAHAAAAVAEAPGKAYNPLMIYGESGLGKTHLLHALGHYVRNYHASRRVKYVSTEELTNDFINAISDNRTTADFRRTYRDVDVLLIDDIQFLGSKIQTQEEFFHTFNTLHTAQKQIVITSDRPPKSLEALEAAAAQPVRMGTDDRHSTARPRNPHRDSSQEGGGRAAHRRPRGARGSSPPRFRPTFANSKVR